MTISKTADNYQKEYGFMALNAVYENLRMFHSIHADFLDDELKAVRDELIKRGVKPVETEEEYKALIAKHGTPPHFQPKS